MIQEEKKKILFDAVSFHFSISVFIYQFLLNLTFPLLIPYSLYQYGWISFYSQGFVPVGIATFIFGYIVPLSFYLIVICVFLSPEYIGYQSLFPIFLYVTHRLMIAFKYATLSPTEYRSIIFFDSLIPSLLACFTHSFIHSLLPLFTHSFIYSFIH